MRAMLAVGFCKPEHATLEQIADVFCACLRNTPPERHGGPAILLNYALKKAWPCPARQIVATRLHYGLPEGVNWSVTAARPISGFHRVKAVPEAPFRKLGGRGFSVHAPKSGHQIGPSETYAPPACVER